MKQTLKDLGFQKPNEQKSTSVMNINEQEKLKIRHLKVHDKTKGDVIVVQPDTLALFIEAVKHHVGKKVGTFGSLGVSLTLLVALLTDQFKDFFGIPAATWQATFVVGFILAVVFTIREAWGFFTSSLWNKDPVEVFLKDPLFKEIPENFDEGGK